MEEGNEIQRAEKIKITLTPQRTQSQAGGGNRLHRPSQTQKCFELLTTNNMKLIQQIHNTWVPDATPGSCMSLHKKQGWGGRMNFTERARVFHVFSTPDVTFRRRSEDFLTASYSKNSELLKRVCTLKKNRDILKVFFIFDKFLSFSGLLSRHF